MYLEFTSYALNMGSRNGSANFMMVRMTETLNLPCQFSGFRKLLPLLQVGHMNAFHNQNHCMDYNIFRVNRQQTASN